mgnify:CR=1 FL=1
MPSKKESNRKVLPQPIEGVDDSDLDEIDMVRALLVSKKLEQFIYRVALNKRRTNLYVTLRLPTERLKYMNIDK